MKEKKLSFLWKDMNQLFSYEIGKMFEKILSDFQENFATLKNLNDLYLKPTQVGELSIRRGARKLSLRNSAK